MTGCLLLVDLGNTRAKWGLAAAGAIRPGEAFASAAAGFRDQLDRRWGSLPPPSAIHVSNVAGAAAGRMLTDWVAEHWDRPVCFAESVAAAAGVANGYERPGQLGVDRWMALLGTRHGYGLPACVADCGTALTFDLVDEDGHHRGGLIAPGLGLMERSLAVGTRGIGPALEAAPVFPGRDTASGVQSGILMAAAGLLEKSVRASEALLGCAAPLILTGGDGEAVGRWLSISYRYDPNLVLRGLLTLAENGA